MKTKKIELIKDKWVCEDERDSVRTLLVSHNSFQTTSIGPFDIDDLKKLRKVVREAIKDLQNENNKSV